MKKTPLYSKHIALGAKMTDFGGWEMPIQYSGIIEEHKHVRSDAGLFDVSHMGEIEVKGTNAEGFLQNVLTNDISKADVGKAVYSPMCYQDGGTVDDLLVYKRGEDDFLLVVNASNIEKDYDWLTEHNNENCSIVNVSDEFSQLAIQGPKAQSILQKVCDIDLDEIGFYHFRENVSIGGINALVSRTGYTGEDGFEIYSSAQNAEKLWDMLLDTGDGMLLPVGLGARDTLRFEAALPLYGNELSKDISPIEAGIGMFVKPDKGSFIGRESLAAQKQDGVKRKIVGFEMVERGIPRSHFDVSVDDNVVGFVTSGNFSPSLNKTLGMALIDSSFTSVDTEIDIIIRNKPVKAKVVKKPFYNKKYVKTDAK